MITDVNDTDEFDFYVLGFDDWAYDNSWRYKGSSYACFVRNEHKEADDHLNVLILLIDYPVQFQAIVIHRRHGKQTEVWAGPLRTRGDVKALVHYFDGWNEHNEPPA